MIAGWATESQAHRPQTQHSMCWDRRLTPLIQWRRVFR